MGSVMVNQLREIKIPYMCKVIDEKTAIVIYKYKNFSKKKMTIQSTQLVNEIKKNKNYIEKENFYIRLKEFINRKK